MSQLTGKVEVVQRQYVPREHIHQFIERESAYWSEVTRQAIDQGKMDGWSLWQRVDALDLDNDHNFMYISTFNRESDLDQMEITWNPAKQFPSQPADTRESPVLGTVKDILFYEQIAFSSKADPKFIRINYAKAENVQDYVDVELEEWYPFVQERMNSGKTNVVSWSLSRIVAPRGKDIRHEAVSVDGFETLSAALFTQYGTDVPFPDMVRLSKVHHKAEVHVYKLIKSIGRHSVEN